MKLRILLIILFVWFGSNIYATNKQPFVVTYDKYDYGASSKNWSIAVNSKGVVYVGNHEGLLEGDGQSWHLYKLPTGGILRSVAVDSNDRIYTGSYEEFGYWDADETGLLNYVSLSDSLQGFTFHDEHIWKIIFREDLVYFQAFKNVFIYDGVSIDIATPEDNIVFLLEAGDKLVSQSVERGLVELVDNNFKDIEGSENLKGAEIKVLLPYEDNSYILGSGLHGLYLWENGEFRVWNCEAHETLKNKQINHGLFRDGNYYIGTITDGVFIFNKKGEITGHLNTSSSLLNNTILGMNFDADGNLWLNHDKGLSFVKFDYPYNAVINTNNQLGAVYDAVLFQNYLYIGTNQGLYFTKVENEIVSGKRLEDFVFVEGSQGQVWELKVFDNQMFCGHNNGTYLVEGNHMKLISPVAGGFNLKRFSQDKLIQSTYTNLVLYEKNDNNEWQFLRKIENFNEPSRYIETDFRGNIWVGKHFKGIYQLKVNLGHDRVLSSKYFGKNAGFLMESHTHVFKIDNRTVFTSGNGIYTYDDLKDTIIVFDNLNQELGRFKNAVKIVETPNNLYWFILNNEAGLFEIQGSQVKRKLQMNFNREGYHFVDSNPNIVALSPSQHLICLEDGFIIVNPEHTFEIGQDKQIEIREISDGNSGKRLVLDKNNVPEIPFRNNAVVFKFSSVSFPGDGNRFSTKLEGLDENWNEFIAEPEKSYSRLPWGEYTFRVKAVNEFGFTIPETKYSFIISPPWYATKYAYAFYTLLAIAFFIIFPFSISRYFKRKQEKYQHKQETIFKEKQKEQQYLAEQKIVKLNNQHLQKELENKSKELANNTMVIIRRNETLTEIKDELEKQKEILGSRFPNKNYEKIIKLINKNLTNEEEWKVFEDNFDQAHNNFFKRLKTKFPSLTPGDLRLCAYLHLNLTTKEIAPLLNISVRGVEIHRYRLRKKLELSGDENLTEFILQF